MEKFQNKYRIPSARAYWHDYNCGVYFVTICTKNREHYFGEICCNDGVHICRDGVHTVSTEPQMQLSQIGQYAYEQFMNVKSHYPYAEIPLFVIMPDHIHAIVTIDGENEIGGNGMHTQCGDGVQTQCENIVRTQCGNGVHTQCGNGVHTQCGNGVHTQCRDGVHTVSTGNRWKSDIVNNQMQTIAKCKGLLSVVVGGLKRAITHFANQNNTPFAWQTRFHDRIVRNQDEFDRISDYIEKNVVNWQSDI